MFEISWSELFILVVVILIFVKPKDLPFFFNSCGRFLGDLKRQANEFRRQFEDAMREAEMENIRKELGDVDGRVQHAIEEFGALAKGDLDAPTRSLQTAVEHTRTADTHSQEAKVSTLGAVQSGTKGPSGDRKS